MPHSDSIQSALARFLAHFRETHDVTLDQIARSARRFGAAWGIQSVRNIEIGRAAPTLPTMITLALALRDLTGVELRLSDLLGDAQSIAPPTALDLPFTRSWIDDVLNGQPIGVGDVTTALAGGREKRDDLWREVPKILNRAISDFPPDMDWEHLEEVADSRREPTLAERRAAARLGIADQAVMIWSIHLWGHSLDDEARARLDDNASPQARGRVTRHLVDEIRSHVNAAKSTDG